MATRCRPTGTETQPFAAPRMLVCMPWAEAVQARNEWGHRINGATHLCLSTDLTQPTKGAGTLRRAIRSQAFARIPGGRHMECAYYFHFCRL